MIKNNNHLIICTTSLVLCWLPLLQTPQTLQSPNLQLSDPEKKWTIKFQILKSRTFESVSSSNPFLIGTTCILVNCSLKHNCNSWKKQPNHWQAISSQYQKVNWILAAHSLFVFVFVKPDQYSQILRLQCCLPIHWVQNVKKLQTLGFLLLFFLDRMHSDYREKLDAAMMQNSIENSFRIL